jgi:hypothetical protein
MDSGVRTPLVDFFRRGEVAREVRLLAARGAMAPRALEQLALLLLLQDDADDEVAAAARATLESLPPDVVAAFLARSEVTGEMRDWFRARGIEPANAAIESDDPLVEAIDDDEEEVTILFDGEGDGDGAAEPAADGKRPQPLSSMSVMQKMKIATRGTREARAALIRDPNRLVSTAVLSSPKLTENEIEGFARMANVSEDVLRQIGSNRAWVKSYAVAANLVKNPKTPLAMSMHLLQRLNDRDVKMLTIDRNVPEPLRIAARKRAATSKKQ